MQVVSERGDNSSGVQYARVVQYSFLHLYFKGAQVETCPWDKAATRPMFMDLWGQSQEEIPGL
jgi:hypothetical protein